MSVTNVIDRFVSGIDIATMCKEEVKNFICLQWRLFDELLSVLGSMC